MCLRYSEYNVYVIANIADSAVSDIVPSGIPSDIVPPLSG